MAFAKRPSRPPAPQTGLDPVSAKLTTLGLDHPAAVLPELIEQAARDDLSPLTFLDPLLTSQLVRKDERRIATILKLFRLPPSETPEGFNLGFQLKADCRQIDLLATCQYLRDKTNVLFLGPPGVGNLAAALGVNAIKSGFSVAHFVLDDLMHVLKAETTTPPVRIRARRYFNCGLLIIINDVGFRPLDRMEANFFFRLVSTRKERGSILLTSN